MSTLSRILKEMGYLKLGKQERKEILQVYKERAIVGGVYMIKNTAFNKILVTSAIDLQGSKNLFSFSQSTNSCFNFKLQKDWATLGGQNFTFEVLEQVEKKAEQSQKEFADEMKTLEALWREKLEYLPQY